MVRATGKGAPRAIGRSLILRCGAPERWQTWPGRTISPEQYTATMLRTAAWVLSSLATLALVHQDPAIEPPLRLTLHLDGRQFALAPGVETEIEVGEKRSRVKVVVEPYRRFHAAGIEFDYPADMAFEHEVGALETWTLDGSDVVLHVHRHRFGKAVPMMRATLTGMVESLDDNTEAPIRSEVTFGGTKYEASTAKVTVGPATICFTAFGIDIGDEAVVVMVQDTLADDGTRIAEYERVLGALTKTFKLTGK